MPHSKDAIPWRLNGNREELLRLANGPARDISDVVRLFGQFLGRPVTRAAVTSELTAHGIKSDDIIRAHAASGSEERELRAKLKDANSKIRELETRVLSDREVRRTILGVSDQLKDPEVPEWLIETHKAKRGPGCPVVMLSDLHWDEVVDPAQINGVNEYNREIATARLRQFVTGTVDVLTQHMVRPEYPGIVLPLMGDLITGEIHDELAATNEGPVLRSVVDLFGKLTWVIDSFAGQFGNVFVPCVTGNHGRNTKKIWAKNRAYTSLEWLLYTFLEKRFENDKRVRFMVSPGPDVLFQVYAHRFLQTHGDKLGHGGDGLIGMLGPVTRGDHKRRTRNAAVDLPYDTLICGHHHQYTPTRRFVVNGSMIGFSEYSWTEGYAPEPPMQAALIVHPERGITFNVPIFCEKPKKYRTASEWVSWSQAA